MPDQAGKIALEMNGGYTRPMGPFHPAEGHGGQLSSLRSAGTQVQPGRRSCFHQGEQFSCTVCVHITAELVSSSLFVQCCTLDQSSRSIQLPAFSFWTPDVCLQPRSFSLLDHSRSFQIKFQKSRRSSSRSSSRSSRSSSSSITQDQILTCYASKKIMIPLKTKLGPLCPKLLSYLGLHILA